jgi:beta-N-acetylhexosaminidase
MEKLVLWCVIVSLFFLSGCSLPSQSSNGKEFDIRGTITNIDRDPETPKTGQTVLLIIRIEGVIEEDTQYDKASVAITDRTLIFEQKGEVQKPLPINALQKGQKVQAKFTGPVAESYPVQATASQIVILR